MLLRRRRSRRTRVRRRRRWRCYNAEDIDKTQVAIKSVQEIDYGAKYPKAVAKIVDDTDGLFEFYNYPGTDPEQAGIREYWRTKVVKEQANIRAELINLYLDGTTAIAQLQAQFDDLVQGQRKLMREVAILEFDGDRIASLREYWASERLSS